MSAEKMRMRCGWKICLALSVLVNLAVAAERPNIVVILADDLGYSDIEPFGAKDFETPNLDQMAKEGRRRTDFYDGGPACTPSRPAIMTGCSPLRAASGDQV